MKNSVKLTPVNWDECQTLTIKAGESASVPVRLDIEPSDTEGEMDPNYYPDDN